MIAAEAAAGGPDSPNGSGSGGSQNGQGSKESYWAQDSQGGDVIYTTDTLLRMPEPGCLAVVKGFEPKAYLLDSFSYYRHNLSQLRLEVLSGVTLALIEVPESIAFAFMAGLSPYAGMASVFWVGTLTGLFGGRPAMISGAAGAMTVIMGDLTSDSGPMRAFTREERVEQLLMCVVLIGALEVLLAPLLNAFVKVIPQPAMVGFMNALAIILVKGQIDAFEICTNKDVKLFYDCPAPDIRFLGLGEPTTWAMLGLIALTLLICLALPRMGRVGRVVPASLVAIVIGTAVEWGLFRRALGISTRTVGDTAALGDGLPGFHWPVLPQQPNWGIIMAYAISLCLIGGVETVMTHEVVNSVVKDPPSSFASIQELVVQGIANFLTGVFGGLGGSALIGETVINVLHGARGRLSCVVAGLTMLAIMQSLGPVVKLMPVAALSGVIFSVSLHTFQWGSVPKLFKAPKPDAFVIVTVTAISVAINLAAGIAAGVALASLLHAWQAGMALTARASVGLGPDKQPRKVYFLLAPLFFGATRPLLRILDAENDPADTVVDMSESGGGLRDLSGLAALNEAGKLYEEAGKRLTLEGLDVQSLAMVSKCPDMASHLSVPALPGLGKEVPSMINLDCLHGEEFVGGPEDLHVGLEMGVAEGVLHKHPYHPPSQQGGRPVSGDGKRGSAAVLLRMSSGE